MNNLNKHPTTIDYKSPLLATFQPPENVHFYKYDEIYLTIKHSNLYTVIQNAKSTEENCP